MRVTIKVDGGVYVVNKWYRTSNFKQACAYAFAIGEEVIFTK